MKKALALLLSVPLLGSSLAFAAATPVVVTDVTDQIAAANAPIGAIGAAVMVVLAIIATWKYVRRAM